MKLDRLRPTWKYYKWQNSLTGWDRLQVLALIESQEERVAASKQNALVSICLFVLLVISCQGG